MSVAKCGVHSRYYLYVQFKSQYGGTFTYNSDDKQGAKRGLQHLMKRVLHRKIKGRFEFAKLVDRTQNKVLAYFKENEMYTEQSWEAMRKQTKDAPYLKASVAFYHAGIRTREKYGLPPLLTLFGSHSNEYGSGLGCALLNLRRQAAEAKGKLAYRMVYIFLHPGNKRVAEMHPDGTTEVTSKAFYDRLVAEKIIPKPVLKIKLKNPVI